MDLFNLFKKPDINQGVREYEAISGAILLDVRTSEEYREGHISGSKNVPLQSLDGVCNMVNKKETPVFVYCYSGSRSRQAASILQRMGYTNVKNIGGIASYTGKVVQ